MTTQYKGYTLNATGDKNWGLNEANVNKKLIDADIALNTKDNVLEEFDASIKNTVQNGL